MYNMFTFMTKPTVVIHRSTAYVALRLVLLETCLEAAYLIGRVGLESLGVSAGYDVRSFGPLLQFWVFVLQLGLMLYVLARWSNDRYEVRDSEIVVMSGIIPRREVAYPFNNIQSITVKVSLLGQILGAGEVSAFVPTLGQDIVFREVPDPHEFADILKSALPYPEKGQFMIKR